MSVILSKKRGTYLQRISLFNLITEAAPEKDTLLVVAVRDI
jgi:hypothetical protein